MSQKELVLSKAFSVTADPAKLLFPANVKLKLRTKSLAGPKGEGVSLWELTGLTESDVASRRECLSVLGRDTRTGNISGFIIVRVSCRDDLLGELTAGGFCVSGSIPVARAFQSLRDLDPCFPVSRLIHKTVPPVVILGRANVNMLAQLRALGPSGVPVHCILTRGEPPAIARASRYATSVQDARGSSDQEIADLIRVLAGKFEDKPVVFTGGDLDVALLARLWPRIEDCVTSASDPVACEHFNDKQLQIDTVRKAGVRVPESLTVNSHDDLRRVSELDFPVICKPLELARKGAFRGKIFVAKTERELEEQLAPVLGKGDASVLVQEYVPGGIENLLFALVACGEGGQVRFSVTGRKLRDNTKGGMGIGETCPLPELEEPVRQTFEAFGVSGLLGVEFKKHAVNGALYYIESNFRPENIHSVNEAAGVNLQLAAYLACIGHPDLYHPLPQRKARWMDFSLVALGWLKSGRASPNTVASSRETAVVRDALWARGDLKPGAAWYLMKAYALIRKVLSNRTKR